MARHTKVPFWFHSVGQIETAALGLTRAESELAAMLARGMTVREPANTTGRGTTTLRWCLEHIFATHRLARQVDLMQLVTSIEPLPRSRR